MKIRPVGAELFHMDRPTDGQTKMTNLTDDFRNFATIPEKRIHYRILFLPNNNNLILNSLLTVTKLYKADKHSYGFIVKTEVSYNEFGTWSIKTFFLVLKRE